MRTLPPSSQWKHEAQRMRDAGLVGEAAGIEYPERVDIQLPEDYLPPKSLKLTANQSEYTALCRYLEALRSVNNEFAGERTIEVEVYLSTTGERDELCRAFREWSTTYFSRRIGKFNPRDRGNPKTKWQRLNDELEEVLGRLNNRIGSVNYLFLTESLYYVRWLLGNNILAMLRNEANLAVDEYGTWLTFLNERRLLENHLPRFLSAVSAACHERLVQVAKLPRSALEVQLQELADDIGEMRPLLVRGFDPAKTIVSLNSAFCVGWDWNTRYGGVAQILTGPDRDSIAQHYRNRELIGLDIKMRRDGILVDGTKPWLSMAEMPFDGGMEPLCANLLVVELLHEKLLTFYDNIDLDRIRKRGETASDQEIAADGEVFAESCRRLANTDPETEIVPHAVADQPFSRRAIRPLRLKRLLKLLEVTFGCEVQRGKGSEITVYRCGYKKFVLPGHKRDLSVPQLTVKRLLNRLGIGIREWLNAVDGVS